jgi:hypothetical protein
VRALFSARTFEDVTSRDEFTRLTDGGVAVNFTLTRTQPERWRGYRPRIDRELLVAVSRPPSERPLASSAARRGS